MGDRQPHHLRTRLKTLPSVEHPDRTSGRFLVVTDVEKAASPPITVILNWPSLLQQEAKP